MGRIMAIDYGRKRVGVAVTDEQRIIATPVGTFEAVRVMDFLKEFIAKENVEIIVVGKPVQKDGTESEAELYIRPFIKKLKQVFSLIPIERYDERYTSKMAKRTINDSGIKKKARQNKELLDSISATILLQSYMESISSGR